MYLKMLTLSARPLFMKAAIAVGAVYVPYKILKTGVQGVSYLGKETAHGIGKIGSAIGNSFKKYPEKVGYAGHHPTNGSYPPQGYFNVQDSQHQYYSSPSSHTQYRPQYTGHYYPQTQLSQRS